ncbi:hypothetical protein E2C01_011206 [Portunus trituberculatus]|uniref:Uncharacterized protein n=1 Tax=Portunus trituberculatus TaxID=210409 RepID=A0A5B7DAF9_PORTR|nr:hypothetical protein [Portunus trituberculatus]
MQRGAMNSGVEWTLVDGLKEGRELRGVGAVHLPLAARQLATTLLAGLFDVSKPRRNGVQGAGALHFSLPCYSLIKSLLMFRFHGCYTSHLLRLYLEPRKAVHGGESLKVREVSFLFHVRTGARRLAGHLLAGGSEGWFVRRRSVFIRGWRLGDPGRWWGARHRSAHIQQARVIRADTWAARHVHGTTGRGREGKGGPGGVGSGARASEAAAGGGAAPGGQTCPVVCYPEPRVRYTSSDRRPLPGMCWCRCSVNSKVSNSAPAIMVENVRGQCGRAAVTRVASSRVELRACRVLACRGVHVVGVNPCAAPAPCPAHYGLCVPVVVTLTDATNGLGTVQPDEEAILKIVEANRKKVAAKRAAKAANQEDRTVPELVDVPSTSPPATVVAAQPKLESQPSGVDVEGIVEAVERWVRGPGEEEQVESAQQKEARQYKELVGTLAELAAEKRAGRVAPGPEPPTGTPRHHETVQLFSELMQTDDVSTIAAHIANKAELIYQTWKRTGLNPTELIQYHTPLPRGEQASDGETSPSGPPSATAKPRTPVRNISPAPPGSSPAVSRKFIEPALHNGRPHATSPVRTLNASPRPYIPPGTSPHSPSAQPQSPPVFPSSNGGSSPHQSPRLLYSSPASPSLSQTQGNSRPYVTSASPQSPRGSLTQPPPPPERSSSYPGVDSTQQQQEGPYDIFVDSNLETSLQELVKSFVLEDKARHHAAAVAALASQRPKASPNPPVSQPGWNETSPPNTSTWPLKNKQPMVVERKSSKHSASASGMSSSASSSSFSSSSSSMSSSNVSTSTNYITTLEARVESSGQKSLGVPLRHKVVAMSAVDQEEERLMHALRTGTLIDDGEHLRPLSQSRPIPTPSLESLQHPHSLQRLDDHRSMSTKQIVNGDGHVMKQRTRFENGNTTLPDSISRGALGIQADEVGSTLPEFYRRKLRKMRKAGSPEPSVVGSISALPHPELTDQQKAHIRERSQSPTAGYNSAGVAIRPFLTQGSVAERVLIFERAPAEMKPKPGAPPTAAPAPEKRRLALSTWREPNEVRSMAQSKHNFSRTVPLHPLSGEGPLVAGTSSPPQKDSQGGRVHSFSVRQQGDRWSSARKVSVSRPNPGHAPSCASGRQGVTVRNFKPWVILFWAGKTGDLHNAGRGQQGLPTLAFLDVHLFRVAVEAGGVGEGER